MPDAKRDTRDADPKSDKKTTRKVEPMPPEGPHARPDLTDHEKTPGTGSLPDSGTKGIDIGPG
ncbi:hypothetical protein K32_36230 [Kaistia sp. 32K]|uniref:hypothetical protein n=1 Tax=Kaistia sp. 32K TaxID=2795690 RepID=UPI0019164ABB|nr:hypothetical protein [Kaistia sp. 32K]BCP55006.1 hypothetical protein K32_36230 [Kaistia sp. 32K]